MLMMVADPTNCLQDDCFGIDAAYLTAAIHLNLHADQDSHTNLTEVSLTQSETSCSSTNHFRKSNEASNYIHPLNFSLNRLVCASIISNINMINTFVVELADIQPTYMN